MGEAPTILVETVRPLNAPQLAGLADVLREAGFEPEHSLPYEQRSSDVVSFIALRLADAASAVMVEKLVAAMRSWISEHVMSRLRERGISSVTVPIYGPRGEVIAEVQVTDKD